MFGHLGAAEQAGNVGLVRPYRVHIVDVLANMEQQVVWSYRRRLS